jgi:UDP-glucose 4-epimerase
LFNVFGPLQSPGHVYAAVVPAFVAAAVADEPLHVFGDGQQARDFVPVATVVRVLAEALERRVSHPTPINLALGRRTTVAELANRLEAVLERPLARRYSSPRPSDVRDSRADDTLLRRLFPDLVSPTLVEALHETVEWWQSVTDGTLALRR